ncbi:MAG TPA: glycoside hydrolase family 2 TIM barrel-domain containing protein [Candidatus Lokiarchaeia archaeon]|nr:glycoside hydrolase family 2 TIM barrel-domain containing protein [Candidatus Lokiarchaeia archaeon]
MPKSIRDRVSLNGFWKFSIDPEQIGEEDEWFTNIPNPETILVPSVWNTHRPELFYYSGVAWYATSFFCPSDWDDQQVSLIFGGVNRAAKIWVNGQLAGEHDLGYTQFSVDISPYLKISKTNSLVVKVDGRMRENDLPPSTRTDWFSYGGIYRKCYLRITSNCRIIDYKIKNSLSYDPFSAKIAFDVIVTDRTSPKRHSYELMVNLTRESDTWIEKEPFVLENELQNCHVEFAINNPALWSTDDPNLYDGVLTILKDGFQVDRVTFEWGIKDIAVDGKKILLNGQPLTLCGVNWIEDHPYFGSTIPSRLIYYDLRLIKRAGINCIRPGNYPPDESVLRLADRLGILIIEEIPAWSLTPEQMVNPLILKKAKQSLTEMIQRDKNHPCVIAWSLGSNCATDTDAGREFIAELAAYTREQDDRLLTFGSSAGIEDLCFDLVDFCGLTMFYGWYQGTVEDFFDETVRIADKFHDEIGDRPIVMLGFGAGAIYGYRGPEYPRWSENYQAYVLEQYILHMTSLDHFAGGLIWTFQDYRINPSVQGQATWLERPREYCNMGIVDEFRRSKMAYDVVMKLYNQWGKE